MAHRGGASQTQRAWTWEELAAATLPRQFPVLPSTGCEGVLELFRRVGPIQSQAARAPFLSVAARLPGATYDAVTEAHESLRVVRSTSLRGTVHTSTREQHPWLAAVAQRTLRPQLRRLLRLTDERIDAFREVLETLSRPGWVEHDMLVDGVVGWLRAAGLDESITALEVDGPRYSLRGHPAMLRRPRSAGAGWESQAEVVYRAAQYAVDELSVDPAEALVELVRHHVLACGPVTRRDLAWWSGAGLCAVGSAIGSLREELVVRSGPNGLDYLDLVDPPSPSPDAGIRLVPEYDALLLGYDPQARERFADEAAVLHSWNRANGVHSPTVLVDGRLRGRWKLARVARMATVEVKMFPGERLLDPGDLTDATAALGTALGVTVSDVRVTGLDG